MQILHREKVSLRLIAIAKKVIWWSDGTITGSNAALATRAGYCSEKTISREVTAYVDLGIFAVAFDWKRPEGEKFITIRTLRPSLPITLPAWIILPEGSDLSLDNSGPDLEGASLDNSGPDLEGASLDNSGPELLDNSGPATIDHMKGGADAA
ncbi:hypothetical protein [Mesorhizobium sp. M4A.F.Ca.ET.050.02.1.1]|uniref:hypothetical protein n=1 Tax=Mesorhizobium sp. M4A.F.Ca.ET.050.02.1.1 TaxID=2496754 RepID=UPI001AECC1C0|nr:hypothetical protein [Mesorhizobium sp. M4A.F.Ca.ET.050.02.1.1]